MPVKVLSTILERLKLSFQDDLCSLCKAKPRQNSQKLICPACEKRILLRHPLPLLTLSAGPVYSACGFPYRMKHLLYGLKFENKIENGFILSEILIHYWQQLHESIADVNYLKRWVVVPIPSHQGAKIAHVASFARPFASHFGYDFLENGLIWQREVQRQHSIQSKKRRRENVSDAFGLNPAFSDRFKPGMKVLLTDDLLTSGATMIEAISTLNRSYSDITIAALTVSHVPLAVTRF